MTRYIKFIRILKAVKKYFSPLFLYQIFYPRSVPVIIVNFNQLETLKELVSFLIERKFVNIYIIDNHSTYKPLLDYYEKMNQKLNVILLQKNDGHLVLFKNEDLYSKLCKSLYILTDPDIIPNKNLPKNFMHILIKNLLKYDEWVTKVGFALDITNIPSYYPAKEKVLKWERRFWENEVEKDMYLNTLDTTFALYKPSFFCNLKKNDHFSALRIAGDFTCDHLGWHIDYSNLTDEQKYYREHTSSSGSWSIDDAGQPNQKTY
jgi:hypothetical protein